MNRKQFLQQAGLGCCAALTSAVGVGSDLSRIADAGRDQALAAADPDKQFIQNWLADLMDAVDRGLDEPAKVRLIGECGRACFERHEFKRNWAIEGKGDPDKLIAALKKNFEVWREGNLVHIRYGKVSKGCYCPAANYREPKRKDIHCYCSRGTHAAVWSTALGRDVRVDLVESVRRGDKTCHFVAHLDA